MLPPFTLAAPTVFPCTLRLAPRQEDSPYLQVQHHPSPVVLVSVYLDTILGHCKRCQRAGQQGSYSGGQLPGLHPALGFVPNDLTPALLG